MFLIIREFIKRSFDNLFFLVESRELIDNFLLSMILRYCNDSARYAYRNIDERSYFVKSKKNFKSFNNFENYSVVIATIFSIDINNSKLFIFCSSKIIEEYFKNDFEDKRLTRFQRYNSNNYCK